MSSRTSEESDALAKKRPMSRREAFSTGAACILGLAGFAACKRAQAFSCDGVIGLSPDEVGVRNRLAYTDHSPNPEKTCKHCQQWVAAPDDGQCGSCKIMKGPVHPGGYCKTFTHKG